MSSLFNDLSEELFQILKGSGKHLTLYDIQGNRTYEPSLARRVFVEPDKMMVSVHEAGSDSEVSMYLSDVSDVNDMAGLINTMRQISTRYNVLLNVRKYGHTLSPKDFAYQVEPVAEAAMYGSTKTSYQRIGETRLVVRHARPVNADISGSRSRNILNLFVETKQGERFRFPVRHLSGARAFAQHINQGGMPHDATGQRIVSLAQESADLAKVSRYIQYAKPHLTEDASALRSKLRERIAGIRSSLQALSRPRGYKATIEGNRLNPTIQIQEGDLRVGAEVSRLAGVLKIDSNHALAESLLPVALLTLGETAMNNINEMFYEGLSVPADLMRELTETLASEYGYAEGADWAFVNKGSHNAIYFENNAAHADACDLLENIMGCGFLPEDVQDKFLAYATNWAKARNMAMGVGDVLQKDQDKAVQELAAGLQMVLSGQAVANPQMPAEMPGFADDSAAMAFKLSLFLEPKAGLKNDALFNYISVIVGKVQDNQKLTKTEALVAQRLADQVAVGEAVSEEEVFEASEDGVMNYAQKWTAARFGNAGTDVLNKGEEERDQQKATAELADGLRTLFMGQPIAQAKYPAPNETPSFTSADAQRAYELNLFLEPEAGLKNDAMFNYISTLIQKLHDGAKLTGPENLIMDKLLDQVDDSAHIGAEESIQEDDLTEIGDYYKEPVDDGSFGKSVDEFSDNFVYEFNDEVMDKISDYAGLSFECLRAGEPLSDYYASEELDAEQIEEIKDAIGSYADSEFSDMDNLPANDKAYIVDKVWPKVQKYLTGLGFQLAESMNEAQSRYDLEFIDYTMVNGVDDVAVKVCCEVEGADPSVGIRHAYATVSQVFVKETGEEITDNLSKEELEGFTDRAQEEMHQQAAERDAEAADHAYDRMRDERMERGMDEDVALMSHPALEAGQHVATDFGPGTIVDATAGGFTVELQNGDMVEVPAEELEPVAEVRMREEAELDAWFEDFDPANVLAPVALDEYQLNKDDPRVATGDRVVHKVYGPGNVVSVEGKFAKVEFDRAHARLPQDRTVSLSPSILYKVSQDAAAIRKEPEAPLAPGDKIRRKGPMPVAAKPGDKIRRKPRDGDLPEPKMALQMSEEVDAYLKGICEPENLEKIMAALKAKAEDAIANPAKYNLPDPHNLHYDDTDEEASEFVRGFQSLLAGTLQDLLWDAQYNVVESEKLEELSKGMVARYFDQAAQERGSLDKADAEGDDGASKKLGQRDKGLDMAFKKMHESAEDEMPQTILQARPVNGSEEDFVNAVARRCGWSVTQQCEDIFAGQALEEQNGNALKYIVEIARARGEDELADELDAFLSMEEGQGEDAGLVLPGDAGDAFIADVTKADQMLQGDEGEYGVYGKKFKTRTFNTESAANDFVEANAGHRILGVKDGKVHVAETNDELEEALGMERILKLAGRN